MGAETFKWIMQNTNQTVSTTLAFSGAAAGSCVLTAGNANGCTATTGPFLIPQSALSPVTILSVDSSPASCELNTGYIKPAFSIDTTGLSFLWKETVTGATVSDNSVASGLGAGTYVLTVTDKNLCSGEIYSLMLKQLGKPVFYYAAAIVSADTCDLGVGSITNLHVNGGGTQYSWTWTKDNSPFTIGANNISQLKKGNYAATVKDEYGCTVTSTPIVVNNQSALLASPLVDNPYILRNTRANITIRNFRPGNYILYSDVNASSPVASSSTAIITTPPVRSDTLYYLKYLRGTCESAVKVVKVKVFDNSVVKLPNAFSPNGDGINDIWKPEIQRTVYITEWSVFNRYGQLVFYSKDASKGWDGKSNGKTLPMGIYYWILTALDNNNKPINSNGSVTILR